MSSCDSGMCGVGDWKGPVPGDPSNDSVLSATSAFGGIDVSWTYPATNPSAVAYVELYRGTSDNLSLAVLVGKMATTFYYDKLETAVRYYYWIRFVSRNGTEGDPIGPASAVANPTLEATIELLTGQIDSGALATALKNQLDQISILDGQLLQETQDRQNDHVSLAQAIQDANDGVAAAHTFLLQSVNDLTDANSAIVEQINGVAATLGGQIGAVTTDMHVAIDSLTGTVDAMYTAQVTVNGLVGGFGLANNGTSVEAGFDVDKFWVGRTSADKRKPFIIDSGVVYIDEGAINHLVFTKLKDTTGNFIVQDGKIQADYLNTRGLAVTGADGTVILSAGSPLDAAHINPAAGWLNSNVTLPTLGQHNFRVVTQGFANTLFPLGSPGWGLWRDGVNVAGADRSYTLVYIRRSDGVVTFGSSYDVFADPTAAGRLASQLNGTGNDVIVVLYSFDEPQGSRFLGGLDAAMYRCGASRAVYGSTQFKARSAYVLIGVPGCGEGNGIEAYKGSVDNDPMAMLDVTFTFQGGNITGASVGGSPVSAAIVAAQATADGAAAAASDRLSKSINSILSATVAINAVSGAGFVAGSLSWDAAGNRTGGYGVAMTPGGITAFNSSGTNTFDLDAATGDAYFGGRLKVGTATKGAVSASLSATTTIAGAASNISSGTINGFTYSVDSGDILLVCNLNAYLNISTNTSFDFILNLMCDGVSLFNGTSNPQPLIIRTTSNVKVAGSIYSWTASDNFDLTLLIPAGTLSPGNHTFSANVQTLFFNSDGSSRSITGSQLQCTGQMKLREFMA